MKSPIVTEFSVYGSRVNCVDFSSGSSLSTAVALFMAASLMFFVIIMWRACKLDSVDRWRVSDKCILIWRATCLIRCFQRFILFIPGGSESHYPTEASQTFELSFAIGHIAPRRKFDLLVRLVGSWTEDPVTVVWLQQHYNSLLRWLWFYCCDMPLICCLTLSISFLPDTVGSNSIYIQFLSVVCE